MGGGGVGGREREGESGVGGGDVVGGGEKKGEKKGEGEEGGGGLDRKKHPHIVFQTHRESGLLSKIPIYFCYPKIFYNIHNTLQHTTHSFPFFQ